MKGQTVEITLTNGPKKIFKSDGKNTDIDIYCEGSFLRIHYKVYIRGKEGRCIKDTVLEETSYPAHVIEKFTVTED